MALIEERKITGFDINTRTAVVIVCMFILLFILPIQAVNWDIQSTSSFPFFKIENITSQLPETGEKKEKVETVNDDRYVNLPISNFKFDKEFKELSTISFTLGVVVLVVSFILVFSLVRSSRKREFKYDI